jgi:hypothetical protein
MFANPKRRLVLHVMAGGVVAGYVYFTSLYLQNVLLFSTLRTGVALSPATVTVMVTSMLLTRRLLARVGHRPLLLADVASIRFGRLWLHSVSGNGNYAANVLAGPLFTAFGMGLAFPTMSVLIIGVGPADPGLAGVLGSFDEQRHCRRRRTALQVEGQQAETQPPLPRAPPVTS